jgi:hypothetical protein
MERMKSNRDIKMKSYFFHFQAMMSVAATPKYTSVSIACFLWFLSRAAIIAAWRDTKHAYPAWA